MTMTMTMTMTGFVFDGLEAAVVQTRVIRDEDVIRAYTGKPGCACGCRGRYYYAPAFADTSEARGGTVSAAKVREIAARVAGDSTAFWFTGLDEKVVMVETDSRVFVVYLRADADVSAFGGES